MANKLKNVAFLCLALISLVQTIDANEDDMTVSDITDMLKSVAEGCSANVTDEQIRELVMNTEDAQMATKCYRYCLLVQFSVLEEDKNDMDPDKVSSILGALFPEKEDELKGFVKKCNAINAAVEDKCEVAHRHAMCIIREMRSKGYNIPEIKD